MAFWEERRLPSTVTGPGERAPFAREATIRLSEDTAPRYQSIIHERGYRE